MFITHFVFRFLYGRSKTDRYGITEILLKVALSTITLSNNTSMWQTLYILFLGLYYYQWWTTKTTVFVVVEYCWTFYFDNKSNAMLMLKMYLLKNNFISRHMIDLSHISVKVIPEWTYMKSKMHLLLLIH